MEKSKKLYILLSIIIIFIVIVLVISSSFLVKSEWYKEYKYSREIEDIVDSLSLREKVGMMFYIRPEGLDKDLNIDSENIYKTSGKITELTDKIIENYEDYPVGGFVLFGKNIVDPMQLKNLTDSIHKLSPYVNICIDEEGGDITRIAYNSAFDVPTFPNMEEIGKTNDENLAYSIGFIIGSYLKEYGIDIDFAPVADINSNPSNRVIGSRAFSSDPYVASLMVQNAVRGFKDSGMLSTLKHFPGHGDTDTDTHYGYAVSNKTWDELMDMEMIPFIGGINEGVELIMVAHISVPNVTGDDLPATLSYEIITNKLRNELSFNGVIVTDALEMGAISKYYDSSTCAKLAILAGNDIVLMPSDLFSAFDGVISAVENGEISIDRIDESVKRILKLKIKRS